MKEFKDWFDVLATSGQEILWQVINFLPKVLVALVLLIIGWLIAKVLEKVANKVLNVIGVDNISEKSGIDRFLMTSGFPSNLSYIFARILFWTILILFLLPVADILGLRFFAIIINDIISYLPNLFVALFILLIGAWGAKVFGGIVRGSSSRMGLDNSELLGTITSIFILVIAFIIALTQLKIETEILTSILLILLASLGLAVAISFGVGSKDIFKNIVAGVYLNKSIREGENVKFANTEGKILHIGTILTKLKIDESKIISVPNNNLLEKELS
jgi:small-conductance mechanosensitive channel